MAVDGMAFCYTRMGLAGGRCGNHGAGACGRLGAVPRDVTGLQANVAVRVIVGTFVIPKSSAAISVIVMKTTDWSHVVQRA